MTPVVPVGSWRWLALAALGVVGCGDRELVEPPPAVVQAPEPATALPPPPASTTGTPAPDDETTTAGGSTGTAPELDPPDPARGTVAPGDSLAKLGRRAGLDGQGVYELSTALTPQMDPAQIKAGQDYRFVLGGDDEALQRFELTAGPLRTIVVERGDDGKLAARAETIEPDTTEVELGFRIETSMWNAMTAAGVDPTLSDAVTDVFAYDIDFYTETRKGDEIRVVVERRDVDGKTIGWGRVLAAEYAGELGTHRVYWWTPSRGEARYVDHEGLGVSRTLLKTPLKFVRVSSEFNPKRMHPVLHRVKGHNGVDYAAAEGTPVWAAAAGKIVFRGKQGGAGNMVIVAHAGGMKTLYMHLSRFRKGQRVGQAVKAKTVIGYVGQTGLATGPHLHFGVKVGGRYVDPKKVERHRGPGVGRKKMGRFRKHRDGLVTRLQAIALAGDATEPAPTIDPEAPTDTPAEPPSNTAPPGERAAANRK